VEATRAEEGIVFESLLIATDFSSGARRAREHAAEWAARGSASLEVLHVVEPPSRVFPGMGSWLTEDLAASLAQDMEGRLEGELAAVRSRVPGATGAVVHGAPYRKILERAETIGADLIVVGREGTGATTGRPLLGSVADRVLRSSSTPVLVVPDGDRSVRLLPKVIVAPSDLSDAAKQAISRITALARELGATVELVHGFEAPPFAPRDLPRGVDFERTAALELERAHSPEGSTIHVHLLDGMPAHVILELVEETKADLVAMASTGRGLVSSLLLGGVTDRIVRTSEVPVLVFPPSRAG
jgi:nucleotide-binding universal stress UspA family protein